jgi:hypothetical protein
MKKIKYALMSIGSFLSCLELYANPEEKLIKIDFGVHRYQVDQENGEALCTIYDHGIGYNKRISEEKRKKLYSYLMSGSSGLREKSPLDIMYYATDLFLEDQNHKIGSEYFDQDLRIFCEKYENYRSQYFETNPIEALKSKTYAPVAAAIIRQRIKGNFNDEFEIDSGLKDAFKELFSAAVKEFKKEDKEEYKEEHKEKEHKEEKIPSAKKDYWKGFAASTGMFGIATCVTGVFGFKWIEKHYIAAGVSLMFLSILYDKMQERSNDE